MSLTATDCYDGDENADDGCDANDIDEDDKVAAEARILPHGDAKITSDVRVSHCHSPLTHYHSRLSLLFSSLLIALCHLLSRISISNRPSVNY